MRWHTVQKTCRSRPGATARAARRSFGMFTTPGGKKQGGSIGGAIRWRRENIIWPFRPGCAGRMGFFC